MVELRVGVVIVAVFMRAKNTVVKLRASGGGGAGYNAEGDGWGGCSREARIGMFRVDYLCLVMVVVTLG